MRVTLDITVNDGHLMLIEAVRDQSPDVHAGPGPLDDTWAVAVSDYDTGELVPFGRLRSCRHCGIPELIRHMAVLADPDGLERQAWRGQRQRGLA